VRELSNNGDSLRKSAESAIEHQLLKEAVDRGTKLKQLAETEAFEAVACNKRFQKGIESAEKAYSSPVKEPEIDKPGHHVSGPTSSGPRQSRVMVAVLISQTLKEIDREM